MGTPVSSTTSPQAKSRRALLAGALGGLGAWAASAVGRASPVRADGETIVVGGEYVTAASVTRLRNQTGNNVAVFRAESTSFGTGVRGNSNTGVGVAGSSTSNIAMYGTSVSSTGVRGSSNTGAGVVGTSQNGTGVHGASNFGLAFVADGRAKFSTSGVAIIPAGSTSKTVTPFVAVAPATFVLLTPKANIGSRALWFTTDPPNDRFRIHMSSPRASATRVAWLLLG